MSLLPALHAFFDWLFAAALHSSTPVYLVIPHSVLEELDGMKHSERRLDTGTVGAAARNASRWLLETVQRQKSTPAAHNRLRWVLHIQTTPISERIDYSSLVRDRLTSDQRSNHCCAVLGAEPRACSRFAGF